MALVSALSMSCGSQNASNGTPIVAVSPLVPGASATPTDENEPTADSTPTQDKNNPCFGEGPFPALPRAPKPVVLLPCRPADKKIEKEVAELIRNAYVQERAGSTVEVQYDCDGLDRTITKIIVESGGGHGSMSMVRFERTDPAASMYQVTGIRLPGGLIRANPPIAYTLLDTQVFSDAIALRMPVVRAALRARVKEVGGNQNSGRSFGSSSSTHIVIAIEDAAGRVLTGRYTGSVSSIDQDIRVPLDAAMAQLLDIIASAQWVNHAPITDEHRQFFMQRFVAQAPHFEDDWAFWVRENYMKLSALMGTRALVPPLLHWLKEPGQGDMSTTRSRDYAVEALVALTGWDPRVKTTGSVEKTRSNVDAAKDFLEECGKVPVVSGYVKAPQSP